MLGSFIFGIVAGWGSPYLEPQIKALVEKSPLKDTPFSPKDLALLTLAAAILAAAILAMVLTTARATPLALGVLVGVLGPKLLEKFRVSKEPDYDS